VSPHKRASGVIVAQVPLTRRRVMLREIKQFSRKTQETILIIQDTVEETGSRIESIEELTKEHHEKARAHYTKIENTLENVSSTILAQATREEEEQRSKAPASCNNPQMQGLNVKL
jgi:hypothetical protein